MSTDKVIVIIAVSIVGALFCAWQVRRALREPLKRDLIVAAARNRMPLLTGVQHDVGPDALRLLEELDDHLNEQLAALAGLYERVGPPEVDAGCDRLRPAVRDEQQKGGEEA
jgi:hypothetical protein